MATVPGAPRSWLSSTLGVPPILTSLVAGGLAVALVLVAAWLGLRVASERLETYTLS